MQKPKRRHDLKMHERSLRELGCIVTGYRGPLTLHHCHGGSMRELGQVRGVAQKPSDWLQIPLVAELHTGEEGVDVIGVETWEARHGRQVEHLESVCRRLKVNVFKLAGFDREVNWHRRPWWKR